MPEILLLHDLSDISRIMQDLIITTKVDDECEACGEDIEVKMEALNADSNAVRAAAMRIHEIVENAYGRARRAEATAGDAAHKYILELYDRIAEAEKRHAGELATWKEHAETIKQVANTAVAATKKVHQDELVAVREECARTVEYLWEELGENNGSVYADAIRSHSPSGALERIQNEARLEEAKWWQKHSLHPTNAPEPCPMCRRIADLEAKLAPKGSSAE